MVYDLFFNQFFFHYLADVFPIREGKAALPLVTSGSLGRKLERVVRRLTRSLGPVRELRPQARP